ncbi:MAG: hypothetical protein ACPGO5_01315 [Patescibacteria group bacterium]
MYTAASVVLLSVVGVAIMTNALPKELTVTDLLSVVVFPIVGTYVLAFYGNHTIAALFFFCSITAFWYGPIRKTYKTLRSFRFRDWFRLSWHPFAAVLLTFAMMYHYPSIGEDPNFPPYYAFLLGALIVFLFVRSYVLSKGSVVLAAAVYMFILAIGMIGHSSPNYQIVLLVLNIPAFCHVGFVVVRESSRITKTLRALDSGKSLSVAFIDS